jgi:hypothetical protein
MNTGHVAIKGNDRWSGTKADADELGLEPFTLKKAVGRFKLVLP